MREKFRAIFAEHVTREGCDELLNWLDSTDFYTCPASTKFHGSYEGGLVEHSIHVWEELIRLSKAYPEVRISAETAAIVTLLHDLCKIGCYKTELRNQKINGIWVQRPVYVFDEDYCFGGHGSKSVYLIQRFMPLTEAEAVAINCHMGPWDRNPNDYSLGNAFEQYPLAMLVHMADMSATYIREKV